MTVLTPHLGGYDVLERPWARPDNRTEIPPDVDVGMLRILDDDDFASLLRDHLTPHNGPGDRERWARLWNVLASDDALVERTLDTLDDFDAAIEELQDDHDATEKDLRRARKFGPQVEIAANRLERRTPEAAPLAWLGTAAKRYNTASREVIDDLVHAISGHRSATGVPNATPADIRLWDVLERLRLDPGRCS